MLLVDSFFASALAWKAGYLLLGPAWLTLLFARGWIFVFPVACMTVFGVLGTIDGVTGGSFFFELVSTSGEFSSVGVRTGIAVTANSADLVFTSMLFRRYLSLLVKLPLAFFMLMFGWLFGTVVYLVIRRLKGARRGPVSLGPFEVR